MEDTTKRGNKKWFVLLILLILLVLYIAFTAFTGKSSLPNPAISDTSVTNESTGIVSRDAEKIIKCQNAVVTPQETTELFTYASGNKLRADYRIGATTDEDSFTTQILFDGVWVYVWNPINRFDTTQTSDNPHGLKMRLTNFVYNVDMSQLGEVSRFGKSPVSGDRLCNEWDGVDTVFEPPTDIEFDESLEIQSKIQEQLTRICRTCDRARLDDIKSTCRKYLGC